jgi:hypothetical protein
MSNDPVLATYGYLSGKTVIVGKVYGGLHFLKGNKMPYFSLTYWEHAKGRPNSEEAGGADHEHILRFHPQFADLADMHLSDMDGVPMHAEGNGWYNLAAALGGMGECYHAGNSKRHFPLPSDRIDPVAPWRTTEYRRPTTEECVDLFAKYVRVSEEEARDIMARVTFAKAARHEDGGPGARDEWRKIVEELRPRWKAQADACIAKYNLHIFGDKWPQ